MAFAFNKDIEQYLSAASAPITDYPCTISFWYKIDSSSLNLTQNLVVVHSSTTNSRIQLSYNPGATPDRAVQVLAANSSGTLSQTANYEQVISANTWYHAASRTNSSGTHIAYFNGLAGSTSGSAVTVSGLDRLFIAGRINTDTGLLISPLSGQLAEVGLWNTLLTASEIRILAAGVTCDKVSPQSLVFYAPLIRNLQDVRNGLSITNNNTATVDAHPRVYR